MSSPHPVVSHAYRIAVWQVSKVGAAQHVPVDLLAASIPIHTAELAISHVDPTRPSIA